MDHEENMLGGGVLNTHGVLNSFAIYGVVVFVWGVNKDSTFVSIFLKKMLVAQNP